MTELKEQDTKAIVDLYTRKTIYDFSELEKREEEFLKKDNIINNMSEEDLKKHSYLVNDDDLKNEVINMGIYKNFIYKDDNKYIYDDLKTKDELKNIHKYNTLYSLDSYENTDYNSDVIDYQWIKNDKVFNYITEDNQLTSYEVQRIRAEAEDELIYPNLKEDIDNSIEKYKKDFKINDKENTSNIDYINNRLEDIYYGIYETDTYYSDKYKISNSEIKRINSEYNLNEFCNEIEKTKLDYPVDLTKTVSELEAKSDQEYQIYSKEYYDKQDLNYNSLATSSLASRKFYGNVKDNLVEHDLDKDIKDKDITKRYSSKDEELINRLKQDELYRKLFKQMKKNEKFLNSTHSNIAYKARVNSEEISLSTSQLNQRDTMKTQSQINKVEDSARDTIRNTRTDNRIHNKTEKNNNRDFER